MSWTDDQLARLATFAAVGFAGAVVAALNLSQPTRVEIAQTLITGPVVAFGFTDYVLSQMNWEADMWLPVALALGALGALLVRRVRSLVETVNWSALFGRNGGDPS